MHIDDMTLIAYLDAQLEDDAQYDAVDTALATDAAVRARLQALVDSGERARQAFAAKFDEPVPAALIEAIINAPLPESAVTGAPASADSAPVKAPPPRVGKAPGRSLAQRLAAWLGEGFGGAAAFASALMLALGALVGHYLLPAATESPAGLAVTARAGERVGDAGLLVALETAPSGRALQLTDTRIQLMMSFVDVDDRLCREYDIGQSGEDARHAIGVACRERDGNWLIAFAASEPAATGADAYRTASDRLHEAADKFLAGRLKAGVMDAAQERALIDSGWQR